MNQTKCINCGFPCHKYGKTKKELKDGSAPNVRRFLQM